MRIAVCTDVYLPQLSGVADSIELVTGELRRLGHDVRIYAPAIKGSEADPNVVRLPSVAVPGSGGSLAVVFPIGGLDDLRAFAPDVIHTHTFSTAGMLAQQAATRLKVPLVGTDHTFPADYLHYLKLDFSRFPALIKGVAARYYNHCSAVLAPSQAMIDQLRASGMTAPARVISNPIRSDLFRPLADKGAVKRKLGIGPEAVLLFGRLAREKNWEAAIAVFALVAALSPAAELTIIGDGPYRPAIVRLLQARGLESRTRFLGILRGAPLVEAINACDVFLITSETDSQSMAMLQAQACGLPVVAVRAGGLPEYVEQAVTGYVVEPTEQSGLVAAVCSLLADRDAAAQMGKRGRASVRRFTPEAVAAEHVAVYRKVLALPRAAAA